MVWDVGKYRWEAYYKAAEEYKKRFGNLEIPCSYVTEDGKKLGVWLNNQKSGYKKECRKVPGITPKSEDMVLYGNNGELKPRDRQAGENGDGLTKERIQKLEALGVCWEGEWEGGFERKYQIAAEYYKEYGNLEMPSTFVYQGENLGKWLNELRLAKKKARMGNQTLSEEKVRRLDLIGMVWEKKDSWEYRCQLLKEYRKEHGDLEISQRYVTEDGVWLGKWIYIQRTQYKKGVLEEWKKERLEEAGICWKSASELAFEKGCEALEAYFNEYQDAEITKGYVTQDGYRLGSWVYRQRKKKKDGKLTGEQVERLAAFGVVGKKETNEY